jgi:steroid delta-isomerase-like uncharacterized protein
MSRDDVAAMFKRRQAAWSARDAAALAADYADDVVIESPMAGVHRGRAAAEQALRKLFNAFVDFKAITERVLIDGNQVAHVVTNEGTHVGEFLGLPPTGKHFHIKVVLLHELEGGKIVRERRIYDFTGFLMQIGVLKAKPL